MQTHAHRTRAIDPARMLPVQKRLSGRYYTELRAVKGFVNTTVIENDALRLRGPTTLSEQSYPELATNAPRFGPRTKFDFPRDATKTQAFVEWLEEMVRRGLVERVDNGTYIRAAYRRGLMHADFHLQRQGITLSDEDLTELFNAPVHSEALESIYTRHYAALNGIGPAVGGQVSRDLALGLSQGWNPYKTAREINQNVSSIGIARARTIARTETMHAVSEATLNRYQQAGVRDVTVTVEFTTAGDNRVCPICLDLEGKTTTIDQARGVIPVHPNCRCVWIPIPRSRT